MTQIHSSEAWTHSLYKPQLQSLPLLLFESNHVDQSCAQTPLRQFSWYFIYESIVTDVNESGVVHGNNCPLSIRHVSPHQQSKAYVKVWHIVYLTKERPILLRRSQG
jgi:hypothetical protein